jgi:hypothetical protein
MTRAQIVRAEPGLIIRHHAFENFPQGTTPHTTAPLDYLIVALSFLLSPFTARALDLAGAICFAIACAAWRLVSLVVVAANEIPVSLGDAHFICDQPHSRSRH